jgi:hypothetical protein
MHFKRLIFACAALLACSGCYHGICGKRNSELDCPTDIRQKVPWCAGEDAVFHCPCGPTSDFYGYKPTCWKEWPAPGTVWRDAYCGACYSPAVVEEEIMIPSPNGTAPLYESGGESLPLPTSEEAEPTPTPSTPPELRSSRTQQQGRPSRSPTVADARGSFTR